MYNEEPKGMFYCPYCGKDHPHQHAVDRKGYFHDLPGVRLGFPPFPLGSKALDSV